VGREGDPGRRSFSTISEFHFPLKMKKFFFNFSAQCLNNVFLSLSSSS
jgi:hypothetical protein